MDRHRENVGPFVENPLRAVAMMDIDVEDRHPLMLQTQVSRGDRAVVEKAKAAGSRDRRDGREGGRARRPHPPRPAPVGLPSSRRQCQRKRPPRCRGRSDSRYRSCASRGGRQCGSGMSRHCVPDECWRSSRGLHFQALSRRPRLGKKAEILGTMHPRPRPLPERDRLDQIVMACLEPREQPVGVFGLLGGSLDDAPNQKELRIMASMQFGIDGLHADAPMAEDGCRRSRPRTIVMLVGSSSIARVSIQFLTADTRPRSRGMFYPRLAFRFPSKEGSRECRMRAAPAVSCAKCTSKKRTRAYRAAENIRHSLRNGFTAYIALSPEYRAFLPPSPAENGSSAPGRADLPSARLDANH